MGNMSSYQRFYWFPKVAELYHGEYCRGCGISKDSTWINKKFNGLVVDKINNDGNHNICDNEPKDFQLLCRTCNKIKNPSSFDPSSVLDLEKTQSEKTNQRAEKPLFEWLYQLLEKGQTVSYKWFVNEGSYKFDISPETIERRYSKKYFGSDSTPFELYVGEFDNTYIRLKKLDNPKTTLDIDTTTPTPLITSDPGMDE